MFIQVVFPSACVIGKLLCLRVFVHLCVSMWSSVNGISVAFSVFYLTTCSGGLNVCVCVCRRKGTGREPWLPKHHRLSLSLHWLHLPSLRS